MVPTRDVLLMPYSTNFNTRIVASASTYGLSAAQVTKFTGLYTPYIEAANAAAAEGQKNKSLVASRNSAKAALMPYFRELYAFIQANSDVADSAKVDLGIVIRRHPAPQPAVATAPIITVKNVYGHNIELAIRGVGKRRGRATNAAGCSLFSYVGEVAPAAGSSNWRAEGNVTRDSVVVVVPDEIAPGSKIFFTGFWYTRRGLSSVACTPIWTHVGFEGAAPLAA
jgi:hypothetical protein